ncbi:DUF922 domain-containing protein [Puteibacter caeruleilacunae]|nr:DUF922 domain-containing protein [Puteibacter caeruleilacunae]
MLRNLLLISFIVITVFESAAQADEEQIIRWSESRKLKWSDFVYEKSLSTVNMEKATIFPMIKCRFKQLNELLSVHVDVFMDRQKSFTSDTITTELLAHEQLHFDIAELYGRMIRKESTKLIQNKEMTYEMIETMIKNKLSAYEKFQKLYDTETKHGTSIKQQKFWHNKIWQMLDDLDDYKSH